MPIAQVLVGSHHTSQTSCTVPTIDYMISPAVVPKLRFLSTQRPNGLMISVTLYPTISLTGTYPMLDGPPNGPTQTRSPLGPSLSLRESSRQFPRQLGIQFASLNPMQLLVQVPTVG